MPFVAPLARFAATAQSPDAVGGLVDDALRAPRVRAAPSGVAFVDFPMDHVFGEADDAGDPGALDGAARTGAGRRRRARTSPRVCSPARSGR